MLLKEDGLFLLKEDGAKIQQRNWVDFKFLYVVRGSGNTTCKVIIRSGTINTGYVRGIVLTTIEETLSGILTDIELVNHYKTILADYGNPGFVEQE